MSVYRHPGAGLFLYECLRVLFLVVFLFIMPMEGFINGAYSVYLSSNALFPLMVLFVWLRPEEYKSFLTLYIAGKVIVVVSFYAWEIFTFIRGSSALSGLGGGYRDFPGMENVARGIVLWGGSVLLSLMDIFSLVGAWKLKNKFRGVLTAESGGV